MKWMKLTEHIPPNVDGWSPEVWLALSNGKVRHGCCLHKPKNATYSEPVHDWFIDGDQLNDDVCVIAWALFDTPVHPNAKEN